MSTIASLVIAVRADTGSAEKDIKGFGSKVGGSFKKSLIPATAALGIMGVVGKAAFANLQDGAKNAAQTEAVLKSTGDASNVTAAHVDDLAMSLRRKAGVDDDVVHSGENMLLTFTNIRNEAGKGNAIFDQATRTMLDMSHALGQDTKSSALQLGKALNDPIKGVTALQRVGVSFTASQRDQIKAMVDAGNTMGAQKMILGELNKEFGGSAANIDPTTKAIANLKLDTVDLASSMLQGLMPALQGLVGILGVATAFMTRHQTATKILVGGIALLATTVLAVNGAMALFGKEGAVVRAATAAWTAAQWLLNAALSANPIGIVIIAAAALGVALVALWLKSQTFRNIVTGAWEAIRGAALSVVGAVQSVVDRVRALMTALGTAVGAAAGVVRAGVGGIVAAFSPVLAILATIAGAADHAVGAIQAVASAASKVGSVGGAIKGAVGHIPGFATGTRNFGGGLAVVGEQGPELVNLPHGASVFTNQASRGMVGGGSEDSGDVVLVLDGEVLARFNRRELTRKGARNVGLSFGT
jgi:phage-related protein